MYVRDFTKYFIGGNSIRTAPLWYGYRYCHCSDENRKLPWLHDNYIMQSWHCSMALSILVRISEAEVSRNRREMVSKRKIMRQRRIFLTKVRFPRLRRGRFVDLRSSKNVSSASWPRINILRQSHQTTYRLWSKSS